MNDETKVEVDMKKPEVTNNEQMVDVKPGVATVVIPSKPVEPKKEEAPKEKAAATITNTEVGVERSWDVVRNYDCEERDGNGLLGNSLRHGTSPIWRGFSRVDGHYPDDDNVPVGDSRKRDQHVLFS